VDSFPTSTIPHSLRLTLGWLTIYALHHELLKNATIQNAGAKIWPNFAHSAHNRNWKGKPRTPPTRREPEKKTKPAAQTCETIKNMSLSFGPGCI